MFRPFAAFLCMLVLAHAAQAQSDPLPSWNAGPAKSRVLAFVKAVTDDASPGYVPPARRIAVFDNDGTLWSEQPAYFQLLFAIDRVKALAPKHPEWAMRQPFKAAIEGDMKTLAESGEKGLLELVMATHAGMATEQFEQGVRDWLATARHPTLKRPYTELVYQPMLELLAYLRANGFRTWIVSGAAFGNSDGDFQMLEWTTSGPGTTLGMIVHHTDAAREFAYDRMSGVGRLDRALTEAPKRGWEVIDRKRDWATVFKVSVP